MSYSTSATPTFVDTSQSSSIPPPPPSSNVSTPTYSPASVDPSLPSFSVVPGDENRWQRQVNTWNKIKQRFGLSDSKYNEFQYLLYLDIDDLFIVNYVDYHLYGKEPIIKGRLKAHYNEWVKLKAPS